MIASQACARRENSGPARSLNIAISIVLQPELIRGSFCRLCYRLMTAFEHFMTLWWYLISGWCQNGIMAFAQFLLIRRGTCQRIMQSKLLLEELAGSDGCSQTSLGVSSLIVKSLILAPALLRPGRCWTFRSLVISLALKLFPRTLICSDTGL